MHIQFDREDPESLAGFTFDNSELDQEQMGDFLLWLQSLNLSYNKLKLRSHTGSSEKVTCIIVKQQTAPKLPEQHVTFVQPSQQTVFSHITQQSEIPNVIDSVQDLQQEDSESDSDSETVSKTKKTTKKVAVAKK
jgi:hypothetical protein